MFAIMKSVTLVILVFIVLENFGGSAYVHLHEGSACQLKDGRSGICKKEIECESLHSALLARSFPLEDLVICCFKGLAKVICCPRTNPITPFLGRTRDSTATVLNLNPTAKPKLSTSRSGSRKADKACTFYCQNITNLDFHIIGGVPAEPDEFPHMAVLGRQEGISISWYCGGTLISERYVLTAAHCARNPGPSVIRLGTITPNKWTEDTIDAEPERITMHPQYDSRQKYNDIALIRLNITVDMNVFVRPACLSTDELNSKPNTTVIATGWGESSLTSHTRSTVLLKVNLTIVGLDDCNQSYVDNGLDRRLSRGVVASQLCARDLKEKGDSCEGDSGGPLQIVGSNGVSTVVGIISFGGIVCVSQLPGVYVNVASYLDWVESVVWP